MNNLYRLGAALIAGTLFGFGLAFSQMIDPAKVLNFLDITGAWDPSLAFVMAGGLAVNALVTPLILKRSKPMFAEFFRLPTKVEIDARIVVGGVIFGIGWGLAGYCPGPMITSLSFANADILTVFVAFVVGTFISRWVLAHRG
ncbi:YeeE/YedE family protein [Neptuniibacter sp. CAU 1671]|uniref:YeeE/YedE family protein n=1 Tax=Neptuniibacter sp. CAU 1671 TaxID=3032593 RepID=UPI0023D99D83|nr:YeeE/YedE family protein [Neptuniibacter sp. CAU 1671]MDF2182065.1 YeeE/YedE family protein [Neptuniibacter sp. CAU 1671]